MASIDFVNEIFHVDQPKFYLIQKVTRFPDGLPRKRPVWQRDGTIFKTLKAARNKGDNE